MSLFQQKTFKIALAFFLSQIVMGIVSLLGLLLYGSAKKMQNKREYRL